MADILIELIELIASTLFYLRMKSPWATVAEAERYAHVSHGVLTDAIRKGEVPAYRRAGGRATFVHLRDVDEWICSWRICVRTDITGGDAQ